MAEREFSDPNPVGRPTGLEYTNTMLNRRRLRQSVKNPLDKCTIVSIFPKVIDEDKITIQPGKFHIDKGTLENPAILVIGGSSWWKDFDPDQDPPRQEEIHHETHHARRACGYRAAVCRRRKRTAKHRFLQGRGQDHRSRQQDLSARGRRRQRHDRGRQRRHHHGGQPVRAALG